MSQESTEPHLPIPISAIDHKYLLFDIQAITWLRKRHHICGVFIGTLPQNPSQNVFMGLPMEIMPEEAQLLIELGLGYILDDARAHDVALAKANRAKQVNYVSEVEEQAHKISMEKAREKELDKKRAMKKTKVKMGQRDSKQDLMVALCTNDPVQEAPSPEDLDDSECLSAPSVDQDPSTPTQSSPKTPTGNAPPSKVNMAAHSILKVRISSFSPFLFGSLAPIKYPFLTPVPNRPPPTISIRSISSSQSTPTARKCEWKRSGSPGYTQN